VAVSALGQLAVLVALLSGTLAAEQALAGTAIAGGTHPGRGE
jgi:hypothetical protein